MKIMSLSDEEVTHKKTLSVYILILAVLTSSHVSFVDILGVRLVLQIFMYGLIFVTLFTSIDRNINREGWVVIAVITTSLLGELAFRHQPNKIFGYVFSLVIVYLVLVTRREKILLFVTIISKMNMVFAFIGIIALVLALKFAVVFDALLDPVQYYNSSPPTGTRLLSLLGRADTWNLVFGFNVLRVSGHVKQSSLLPAYYLIPLAISLAYSRVDWRALIIIMLFLLLTMGGTVYVSLFMAAAVYFSSKVMPKEFFVIFPFIVLFFLLGTLVYFFFDVYDPDAIKSVARNAGKVLDDGSTANPIRNRAESGLSRFALIGFASIAFVEAFPFPAETKILSYVIGSNIVTSGLRGGLFAFLASIVMYWSLFSKVSLELSQRKEKSQLNQFGFSLLYALIFQSAVYNDFGFSTYYGFLMWACILVLLGKIKVVVSCIAN